MTKKFGKNYLGGFYKPSNVPYTVKIDGELVPDLYSEDNKKMLSMKRWCARNTTAGWAVGPYQYPIQYVWFLFKKKDDAIHFKMVWG